MSNHLFLCVVYFRTTSLLGLEHFVHQLRLWFPFTEVEDDRLHRQEPMVTQRKESRDSLSNRVRSYTPSSSLSSTPISTPSLSVQEWNFRAQSSIRSTSGQVRKSSVVGSRRPTYNSRGVLSWCRRKNLHTDPLGPTTPPSRR